MLLYVTPIKLTVEASKSILICFSTGNLPLVDN